jgi:hypothetical protein
MEDAMATFDPKKELKPLYTAKKKVEEVIAERGVYLAIDGVGAPGGDAFQQAMEQLFGLAWTLKYWLKGEGRADFKVPSLEVQWRIKDPKELPMDQWPWTAMLRVHDDVTGRDVVAARKVLKEKKDIDAKAVRRRGLKQGRSLQVMHAGPYDGIGEGYGKILEEMKERGAKPRGYCVEIYLNDPNRTAPEKLKTILRWPISLPRPSYARGKAA